MAFVIDYVRISRIASLISILRSNSRDRLFVFFFNRPRSGRSLTASPFPSVCAEPTAIFGIILFSRYSAKVYVSITTLWSRFPGFLLTLYASIAFR